MVDSGRNRVKLFLGGGGPYPGADTGFPEGGGEDIHKHPPLDIARARVTSSTFQGVCVRSVLVTHTLHRFSVSGQVQGGVGDHSCHPPPPGSATAIRNQKAGRNKGRAHDLSS